MSSSLHTDTSQSQKGVNKLQGAASRSCEFVTEFADADQHGTFPLQSVKCFNSLSLFPQHSNSAWDEKGTAGTREANFSCPVINPGVLMIVSLYKANVAQVKIKSIKRECYSNRPWRLDISSLMDRSWAAILHLSSKTYCTVRSETLKNLWRNHNTYKRKKKQSTFFGTKHF